MGDSQPRVAGTAGCVTGFVVDAMAIVSSLMRNFAAWLQGNAQVTISGTA